MTRNESTQVTPGAIAAIGVGIAAAAIRTVAGLTVEPEDIGKALQQIPEQVQHAVQDYLGTNNCKK
ncbi:hypothetical protein [Scytonema sp. PCC 10023]|uniref:hypothetical protein n=1 Tax=Scytonema sp. PCC 10023 TaxID=1680591 RepID=UPI0039C6A049